MANEVHLKQTSVKRSDVENLTDTSFKYFAKPIEESDPDTVEELFRIYRKLYLELPVTGENSHQVLVEESSKIYLQEGISTADIQPLLNEVADLRKRLLEANEQIQNLVNAK